MPTIRSLAALLVLAACGDPSAPLAPRPSATLDRAPGGKVSVALGDCLETIGVALAPTASVRALVPVQFLLVGDGQPVTPLVVRTSQCDVSVDGARTQRGEIVQIGAIIVPPDGTGDVSSALLWYYTSDAKLAHALGALGVDAQHVPTIGLDLAAGAPGSARAYHVAVRKPGSPTLDVAGTVAESVASAGAFVANWWTVGPAGVVKMTTSIPSIAIGGASLALTTPADGALAALLGPSAGFPILQQFNTFASAELTASVVP
ncbi:hypothetical protein J421_4348 [Gemmatirosa kalamazoonensis]|uniref:Uncharacterized protein n=1 Tax=Gemmatirosa kalamazoonensis TaxID=861299 RepID=W0RNH9_9BACT|nr:hypothetical protein [Gemmatirosa kalamazoonensis]AHG91885.1 hypothetical protein J421_4348 [Gemmatirosa kalamazoonensis]